MDVGLFLAASVAVTVAPGPDNLQVLARSLSQGRSAGLAATLGFASGCLVHTLWAVLGVAAVLRTTPWAFDAVRYAGAAYLLWLGVQAWCRRGGFAWRPAQDDRAALARIAGQSALANILNPKVTLFFLVFLPQFVQPAQGHAAGQMLALGALFMAQTFVVFGAIAWFAGGFGAVLARRPAWGQALDRLAGAVFILLAMRMVWGL